jgi:DNA-binding NarL/FixJ family response regulator
VSTPEITCLIVDDHEVVREGLRLSLSRAPHIRVIGEAGDGESAIALVERRRPNVVIMDVQMPGIDGVEATRRILLEAPDTRIVILTGGDDCDVAEAAVRAGAVAYVLKGREPDEIFEAILNATATW